MRGSVAVHSAVAKIGVGNGDAVEGSAGEALSVDGHHLGIGLAGHWVGFRQRTVAGKGDDVFAVNLLEFGKTYRSTRTPLA